MVHSKVPNLILGYHGCEKELGMRVLNGEDQLISSENSYDWLGKGIYFWEFNPSRANEWAQAASEKSKIKEPFVLGAVLSLGNCLNLDESAYCDLLSDIYPEMVSNLETNGKDIPRNRGGDDLLLRHLDCAVINYLHELREEAQLPRFDSVRATFVEGEDVYPGSGFRRNTHTQIAILNPEECILGYFRPETMPVV